MKRTPKTRHLEIMVGGCDGTEFAVIREFLEHRGYRLTESRHGDVYRLWAQPPGHIARAYGVLGAQRDAERREVERARSARLSADEMRLAGVGR